MQIVKDNIPVIEQNYNSATCFIIYIDCAQTSIVSFSQAPCYIIAPVSYKLSSQRTH